jgi:phospholipid transport system transporter-binding protein
VHYNANSLPLRRERFFVFRRHDGFALSRFPFVATPLLNMLSLGTSLTNRNAAAMLRDGLARVAQGEAEVDCGGLGQVDSAAVAVMLALARAAKARNTTLRFVAVPRQLAELATLYGVDGLLGLAAQPSPHRH